MARMDDDRIGVVHRRIGVDGGVGVEGVRIRGYARSALAGDQQHHQHAQTT